MRDTTLFALLVCVLTASTATAYGQPAHFATHTEDAGTNDAGTDDAGTDDAGTDDAGAEDAGTDDAAADIEPGADPGETPTPEEVEPPPPAPPEGHVPEIAVSVDPEEGLVTGDVVTVTIRAKVPAGDDVSIPDAEFAPLAVLAADHAAPSPANDQAFVFEFRLLALRPGVHAFDPIQLRVLTESGAIGFSSTPTITISVGSVLGNEPNAQPKPPSEPVVVLEEDYTLAWIGGGLLVLLLTVLITWLVSRWWAKRPKTAPPPPPPRPAWEIALEKLTALRAQRIPMCGQGRAEEWVDGVSDALREYLGGRYGFDGLESTTDEIAGRLRKAKVQDFVQREIAASLGDSDLIKFAKATPDEAFCERLIESAERIVRRTSMASESPVKATPPMTPGGES